MRKNERLEIFRSYLKSLIYEGGENNFVIFTDIQTNKFVQFAGSNGERLIILDIPMQSVSKDEENLLNSIFEALIEPMDNSFQALVTPDQGARVAEKVFRDVFLLPDTYNIEVEIKLE